jgi:hypothetical protein
MSVATLPEGDWIRGISIKQPYAAWIIHEALRVREDTGAPSSYDAAPERRGRETAEFMATVVEAGLALGASRG